MRLQFYGYVRYDCEYQIPTLKFLPTTSDYAVVEGAWCEGFRPESGQYQVRVPLKSPLLGLKQVLLP